MAYVGQHVNVGDQVPAAGVYQHINCSEKATFSDVGDKIPPCPNQKCSNRKGPWKIVELTGTTK